MTTRQARYMECLSLTSEGYTRPEIAELLHISVHTVKNRLDYARKMMGARNIAQAVATAVRTGRITTTDKDPALPLATAFAELGRSLGITITIDKVDVE
jgi:DNA-binding CsgD family transcriptional regulator